MRTLLSALADGSLSGLVRWYAESHTKLCVHCSETLEALQALREQLRELPQAALEVNRGMALSEDRWKMLDAAWSELDAATVSPGTN
jgi:hypothetical protein